MGSNSSSVSDETISRIVLDACNDENVRLVRATGYGSRARRLDDESSDYDVFFVFEQNKPEYVVKTSYVDTIEKRVPSDMSGLDVDVELHGWNIRKYIGGSDINGNNGGILGSDPMACESIASEDVYYVAPCTTTAWDQLDEHVSNTFKPYALMKHYEDLAEGNYKKYVVDHYRLADGVSYEDVFESDICSGPGGYDVVDSGVDPEESEIRDEFITISTYINQRSVGQVSLEDAKWEGFVTETTTDVSRKRYLHICQALCKRRYIAETERLPPMNVNRLLKGVAGDIPSDVYAYIGDLTVAKRNGTGDAAPPKDRQERLNEWIESELDVEFEPDGYVDRTPNVDVVTDLVEDIMGEK